MTTDQQGEWSGNVVPFERSGGGGYADRTPPQDLAAEQSVLGAMLLSKDAIGEVTEVLKGRDFYRPAHEYIYDAVMDLYGSGEPIDAITVADHLGKKGQLQQVGGHIYLHELLSSVSVTANATYYAEIVRDKAVLRRLVDASMKISQMGYQAEGDVTSIVDRAQQTIYEVAENRTKEDYQPLSELVELTLDEIEALTQHGQMAGVPTGFIDLDHLTNGLHPGQMIIIAARPGMGKSTLGLDFARSAAIRHGLCSVFYSLEMTKSEIVMRLMSAESGVPLNAIRKGDMTEEYWQRISNKTAQVSRAPLFIDDSPNLTMMEIRAKSRRLKQRNDLKLIIIDYMQLMTSGKKVESRQLEVSEFSRQIKLLAKELEVPVVALSQLNRGPEARQDKKPMLSDLRESGCLTADTRVLRADTGAEVTMGALLESGERNVPVWSLDADGRLVARPMTHVFSSGVKKVYRLRLTSGREVKASANHPFLTRDGWMPLGELAAGTELAVPRFVPEPLNPEPRPHADVRDAAKAVEGGADLPDWVPSLPNGQLALFLNFLAAGTTGPLFQTRHRRLADDLARLWLRLGAVADVQGGDYGSRFVLDASPFGAPADGAKDIRWHVIASIDYLGEEEVFDATVLDTHNFVADGISVHNSLEQDADMVILLHREDAYDKQSPRQGEADFIVAKHRNGATDTLPVAFQGALSRFVDMQR